MEPGCPRAQKVMDRWPCPLLDTLPIAMNGMARRVFERARNLGDRLTGGGIRSLARRLLATDVSILQQQALKHAVAPEANKATSLVYLAGAPDTPSHQYRVVRYIEAATANDQHSAHPRQDR